MQVKNQLYPSSPEQMASMLEPGPEGPIIMVNLLKFRDRAVYKDGRETDLSGREAYEIYGQAVSQYITEFGGEFCLLETSRISPSAKSMICGMRLRSLSTQTVLRWSQ